MAPDLAFIAPERLAANFARAEPLLTALAGDSQGRFRVGDFVLGVQSKMMQLWLASEGDEVLGAMLSEIVSYPHRREANLFAATGRNADRWIGLMPRIEEWARAEDCFLLKASCRPGWEKLLRPIGFEKSHVILEKAL